MLLLLRPAGRGARVGRTTSERRGDLRIGLSLATLLPCESWEKKYDKGINTMKTDWNDGNDVKE